MVPKWFQKWLDQFSTLLFNVGNQFRPLPTLLPVFKLHTKYKLNVVESIPYLPY